MIVIFLVAIASTKVKGEKNNEIQLPACSIEHKNLFFSVLFVVAIVLLGFHTIFLVHKQS